MNCASAAFFWYLILSYMEGGGHKVPGLCLRLVMTPLGSKFIADTCCHFLTMPKDSNWCINKYKYSHILHNCWLGLGGFSNLNLNTSMDGIFFYFFLANVVMVFLGAIKNLGFTNIFPFNSTLDVTYFAFSGLLHKPCNID